MYRLNELTRKFHDQSFENIQVKDNKIIITIAAYEIGEKYGFSSSSELKELEMYGLDEELRYLNLIFYDVSEIDKDFDSVNEEGFTIYDLTIEKELVTFCLYDDNQKVRIPKMLKFKADSFELKYL